MEAIGKAFEGLLNGYFKYSCKALYYKDFEYTKGQRNLSLFCLVVGYFIKIRHYFLNVVKLIATDLTWSVYFTWDFKII